MLFPLIGLNDNEINQYSKKIDFLNLSIGAKKSIFPKKQINEVVLKLETKLNIEELVKEGLRKIIFLNLRRGSKDIHDILNEYLLSYKKNN